MIVVPLCSLLLVLCLSFASAHKNASEIRKDIRLSIYRGDLNRVRGILSKYSHGQEVVRCCVWTASLLNKREILEYCYDNLDDKAGMFKKLVTPIIALDLKDVVEVCLGGNRGHGISQGDLESYHFFALSYARSETFRLLSNYMNETRQLSFIHFARCLLLAITRGLATEVDTVLPFISKTNDYFGHLGHFALKAATISGNATIQTAVSNYFGNAGEVNTAKFVDSLFKPGASDSHFLGFQIFISLKDYESISEHVNVVSVEQRRGKWVELLSSAFRNNDLELVNMVKENLKDASFMDINQKISLMTRSLISGSTQVVESLLAWLKLDKDKLEVTFLIACMVLPDSKVASLLATRVTEPLAFEHAVAVFQKNHVENAKLIIDHAGDETKGLLRHSDLPKAINKLAGGTDYTLYFVIAGVVLLIAVALVAGFFYYRRKKASDSYAV